MNDYTKDRHDHLEDDIDTIVNDIQSAKRKEKMLTKVELPAKMACKNCEQLIPEDSDFCNLCGSKQ